MVSGKTPDPAKEGWKTLVGGKLDAEQSPTATVTLDGAVGVKKVESTTETRSASPPAILAPTKKPQGASKPAMAAANPPSPRLRRSPRASQGVDRVGGRGASPKVDLKAEMEAAKATRAATPPPQLGKKDAASSGSPRRDADDKKGARERRLEEGWKNRGRRKAREPAAPARGAAPRRRRSVFLPAASGVAAADDAGDVARARASLRRRARAAERARRVARGRRLREDDGRRAGGCHGRRRTRRARRAIGRGDARDGARAAQGREGRDARAERRATDLLIRAVNAIVQSLYPQASVEVFGSFPTASWTPGRPT